VLKVIKDIGKVVGGWNEARRYLGSLQNAKPKLEDGWIFSISLDKFPCKMMKLVRVLVKVRNDHGWMKLEGDC